MMKDTRGIIPVQSREHAEMVEFTRAVQQRIPSGFNGICHLFCRHTTAALTINENADPDVVHDLLQDLERLIPWRQPFYQHQEGNSAAHLKASLLGPDLAIPVTDGRLCLGTWQGIYFCEFDGPRPRQVVMQLMQAIQS